jgi:hypothetical protein
MAALQEGPRKGIDDYPAGNSHTGPEQDNGVPAYWHWSQLAMFWTFSSWLRHMQARLGLADWKWPRPAYTGVKRAYLRPLESLESRVLFSVGVWMPQRLVPIGGVAAYNVSDALFQPVTAALQPQTDLRAGSIAVAGSFTLTDTGSYTVTLSQSGTDGLNTFYFNESGSVSFTLTAGGGAAAGGYSKRREAISRTLVALGYLSYTRRRIPSPI